MKHFVSSIVVGALALSGLFLSADADACGGCFHIQQSESGQVTGHRMIFSVSNDKTTLWDQISYEGAPESFAWVLPIKGQVEVGLSSDALFEQLEGMSRVMVFSPDIDCGVQTCDDNFNGGAGGSGGGWSSTATTTTSSVTVIAQETVGPFETVQLSSQDPAALEAWLEGHGYAIPDDIVPVITAYVNEGFDFLALRLAPGEGVSSMRPVRVTSPGAGLGLPLRMVAAGTGAITPITLWILGEGRYEAANFPNFTIQPQNIVWNWDTMSSNYAQLKQDGFVTSQNKAWLTEAAFQSNQYDIRDPLVSLAQYDPASSGYGENADDALTAAEEDLDALIGSIDKNSLWMTRIHGQLSKEALSKDLMIGAAASQQYVAPVFYASQTTGTPPECPPPPECGNNGSGGNAGGQHGVGLWTPGDSGSGGGNANKSSGGSGGCAMGGETPAFGAALAALGLAAALRRRRARRAE